MSEKVAQERPAPAVDQIWRCQVGPGCHFEITIGAVKDGVVWPVNTRDLPQAIVSLTQARWSCIGLVTPHGRVMVGETREGAQISSVRPRHWRVVEVVDSDVIRMTDGNVTLRFSAQVVARWPLIFPPASAAPDTYAAMHEEHPRPGTVEWLVKSIAYLCSIPKGDVSIQEDHARALITVRVPRSVTAQTMRSADEWLRDAVPLTVCVRLGYVPDPREQGPGISRQPPPEVRPDVVVTAAWDRWSLP